MLTTRPTARHTTDSPDWYTPFHIIAPARDALGGCISLDPASDLAANQLIQALRIYTAKDDGLSQPWRGTVFHNPPGGLVNEFWCKLEHEYLAGRTQGAIWIGYSLEQLQTLQHSGAKRHPLDYPLCIPARRITFRENRQRRTMRLAKIAAENAIRLREGKPQRLAPRVPTSPSHGNYICYLGDQESAFRSAFVALGRVA